MRAVSANRWLRDVGVLMGGSVGGQMMAVALLPITVRLFDPSELGTFAVFLAGVTILYAMAALRFDAAIPVPEREDVASSLAAIALRTAIGVGIIATLVGALLGQWLGSAFDVGGVSNWLWLIGPTVLAASTFQTLVTWNTRVGSFGLISIARLVQGLGLAGGQIVAGVIGAGVVGLLFVPVIAWTAGSAVLAGHLIHAGGLPARTPSLRAVASRYRRFPLIMSWSVVANRISTEIAPVAIAALHGPKTAGLFLLASRITYRPVSVITQSMSQVYFHRAARVWATDPVSLRRMIARLSRTLLLVSAIPAAIGVLFGPQIFALVLGESWRDAGRYATYLIPMAVAGLVSTSFTPTFAVTERQDLQLYREVIRLVVVLGSFGLAMIVDASPSLTVAMYGVASTVGYLLLLGMVWRAADPEERRNQADFEPLVEVVPPRSVSEALA